MDLDKVKDQVEFTLKNNPATRNNDKLLQVLILKGFYNVSTIEDILRSDIPSLESIRRCRQKLQADGYYPASIEVKVARSELEETFRQFAITKE